MGRQMKKQVASKCFILSHNRLWSWWFRLLLLFRPRSCAHCVIVPKANLHLEPTKSPQTSAQAGDILEAQASMQVRFKRDWIFVYYQLPDKGKTLAGYVQEQMLRKLFPEVNSVLVSSGEADYQPKRALMSTRNINRSLSGGQLRISSSKLKAGLWLRGKSGETEVYQYRRQIMNKQCLIEYVFWRYELISARFHLLDNYTDNNYYISDYLKIKNYLEARAWSAG